MLESGLFQWPIVQAGDFCVRISRDRSQGCIRAIAQTIVLLAERLHFGQAQVVRAVELHADIPAFRTGGRLGDYWVFVSNTPFLTTDTPATLMNRAGTFASHQTTAPNPSTITVGAPGQYVRVQLSSAGYLTLAEMQVFGQ
jgi:hypothetical protein